MLTNTRKSSFVRSKAFPLVAVPGSGPDMGKFRDQDMRIVTSQFTFRCILPFLCGFCSPGIEASSLLHHELRVKLDPTTQRLEVSDSLRLPEEMQGRFILHAGLNPVSTTPGVRLETLGSVAGAVPLVAYRVDLPAGRRGFTLVYGGTIAHEFSRLRESPGLDRQLLAGSISNQGAYLDGSSGWYPAFPGALQSFDLRVNLPEGWLAISQGEGPSLSSVAGETRVHWHETSPQDEIYLVAEPSHLYRRESGGTAAQVYLREPDAGLAERYLDATQAWLKRYSKLLGPYPYAKFALVENFWETGYGMPSFTLLGPRVLRLPFILQSSYPHEILHNWWGNGVYVDDANGNWSEGLTTYLADHLIAEEKGQGGDYRHNALGRYGDFVRSDNDFPLTEFRARHSGTSQAVGYDKGLMLFHMLRRRLGDDAFIEGLRRFYRDNRFKHAGFEQLQAAFEAAGGESLADFFRQWTRRTGAPALDLKGVAVKRLSNGYRLSGEILQTQESPPFDLRLPLAITLTDGSHQVHTIDMGEGERRHAFAIDLPATPARLILDPWFDLFRQLAPGETPPRLGGLFGADRITMILPAAAPSPLLQGYRRLAETWAADYPQAQILLDDAVQRLPADRAVLLLGWENRFASAFFDKLEGYPVQRAGTAFSLMGKSCDTRNDSFAIALHPRESDQTRVWIGTHNPASLPGLTRKLPHYGKYSVLAFTGDTPDNHLKGQWPVLQSPLHVDLNGVSSLPSLPEPAPLKTNENRE